MGGTHSRPNADFIGKGGIRVKLIYIRTAKSRGYIRLGIQSGEEKLDLTVSEEDYRTAGSPLTGDDVDSDTLDSLSLSDMRYRARLYALRILSYADNNETAVVRKLRMKGIDRQIAEETASEMVGLGYINEARQLQRLITDLVNRKLIGPKKLFPMLLAKGYNSADIEQTLDRLILEGVIDFEKSKAALIEKHSPENSIETKKLIYKNGYEIC